MSTTVDASYVSDEEWQEWERDMRARNACRARRERPAYPSRADLEAQLHALRTDRSEREAALSRRVAELERLLDQAWRVVQAMRGSA
jgi:hypothetical protein